MNGADLIGRHVAIVASVWLLACSSCASSGGQKKAASQQATSDEKQQAQSSETSSQEGSKEGSNEGRGRMEVRKRVHFEEILDEEIRRDRPPGCIGSWEALNNTPYNGQGYFCSEFNGPKKWGDIPVTMVVQDGRLSVISVQVFFDGSAKAKSEWEDFTGNLIGRCDRKTGFERYEIYQCEDHVVDVRWQPGHDSAQLQVVYARSMKSLQKKKKAR